jgi:hypothetical protein
MQDTYYTQMWFPENVKVVIGILMFWLYKYGNFIFNFNVNDNYLNIKLNLFI